MNGIGTKAAEKVKRFNDKFIKNLMESNEAVMRIKGKKLMQSGYVKACLMILPTI